jgi:nucleotide-binding universal stress UspA family protein
MIAMSTHGRQGIGRWALGSVADRVLQASNNPLLLVRAKGDVPAPAPKLENVIVALDGSDLAEQVLPYVTPLAKALDLKLLLVRVTLSPGEYHRYFGGQPRDEEATSFLTLYEEFSETVDTEAKIYLHETAARLKKEGIAAVEEHLMHGNPAEEIVGFARATPNTLVAMTSHGRTGIKRWVLGSVADRVIRDSGDPVLLIRAAE